MGNTGSPGQEQLDLTAGVPLETIQEGKPVAGSVGSDSVMLVRLGSEIFALGAACTHYSGPLPEGMIVGDQIRCPWHHACFSLRTGDALAAPALNPLPRWQVEQRDGKVFVGERYPDRDPLEEQVETRSELRDVVIIGGGAAGTSAAEALRRYGYDGSISIVDPDPDAPYDRPNLSKDYLAGNAPDEWLPLRPDDFNAQHSIHRIAEAATALDAAARQVVLASGRKLAYDGLILATGAAPVRIPVPGNDLPHVYVLRTLADCQNLIHAVENAKSIVVVGASFIGMEATAALRARNLAVTVVAPEQIPFERVLGKALGESLLRLHQRHGVQFRLGRTLRAITASTVLLDDGTELDADVVLLGVGVRPQLDLAKEAGIDVDRGVAVNEYLETSVPGIYAAGDIARFPDPRSGERIRIEHWVVAQRQGAVAARNLLGEKIPFTSVPFFWTAHYGTTVNYVGHAEEVSGIDVDGDPDEQDCAVKFMKGDRLLAYVTIGRDRASLEAERELETWHT